MKIAEYYASLGFRVDRSEVRKVDRFLNSLEKKLANFGKRGGLKNQGIINLSMFKVDDRKLTRVLGDALDNASRKVTFEITKFVVNDRALRASLLRAARVVGRGVRESAPPQPAPDPRASSNSRSSSRGSFAHMGGTAGAFMRYGVASLPFIGGVYGLGALNRSNQEAISARLTTQAVLQSKGYTEDQGKQAFGWLRNLAYDVGFNYMDAAPEYNQFLSNALGAGFSVEGAQDIFQGFAEYQTAMGVTPARRKLVQGALSQMLGKGKVTMEELRRQMAESMPGTMDVFAEAYAELTESGLSGQQAIEALDKAVGEGKVVSAHLLPIVSEILKRRAAPKLDVMKKTSIAEQARAQIRWADMVFAFGQAGGEEGFARIWRSLTIAIEEATPFAEKLGKAFNEISKYASFLILLPQSIQRAFDGRDSWFADAIGKDRVEILKSWYKTQKEIFDEAGKLLDNVVKLLKVIFEQFGGDMLTFSEKLSMTLLYTLKALNAAIDLDFTGVKNASAALLAVQSGASREDVERIAAGEQSILETNTPVDLSWTPTALGKRFGASVREWFTEKSDVARARQQEFRSLIAPDGPFANDIEGAREYMRRSQEYEKGNTTSQNNYEININVDPAILNNMDTAKQAEALASAFQIALQQMPA